MSKWYPVISSAVAVFAIVMWLSKCDRPYTPPQDDTLWRQKVIDRERVIHEKDSIIAALSDIRKEENKKAKRDSSRLSIENRRLSVGYSRSKQQVQELQDSTGRIQAYVAVTDSLLNAKDSLYYQEVGHRIALEQLYKVEIATLADKNVIQVKISDDLMTRVTDLEQSNAKLAKQSKRRKSWNNFWKGLAAGTTAATAVIILSNQ